MPTIATATQGSEEIQIVEEGPLRRMVVRRSLCGESWWEIDRELCPLSEGEADAWLECVTGAPTYDRVRRLATEGADRETAP